MTLSGIGKFKTRKTRGKYFVYEIYIPKDVAEDSQFPLKLGEVNVVCFGITGEKPRSLLISQVTPEPTEQGAGENGQP
jgi:hypothetical protein